jgi:hypothetical protein
MMNEHFKTPILLKLALLAISIVYLAKLQTLVSMLMYIRY